MAADWKKIKTEYITTNTSYRKLSQKYGVGLQTICNRSKAEGWIEQREQHENKTVTKTLNAISNAQANRAARLQGVADKLLGKVENLLEEHEDILVDTQALRHISATLKDIKEIQMIRSDSDMREQEARIRNLQKQAEREDDDNDRRIVVSIAGGDDAWAK